MLQKILIALLCFSFLAHGSDGSGDGWGGGGGDGWGSGGSGDGWGGDGGDYGGDSGDTQSVSVTGQRGGPDGGAPGSGSDGSSSTNPSVALVHQVVQTISLEELQKVIVVADRLQPFVEQTAKSIEALGDLIKFRQYYAQPTILQDWIWKVQMLKDYYYNYNETQKAAVVQALNDFKALAEAIGIFSAQENLSIQSFQNIITVLNPPNYPAFDASIFSSGDAYRGDGISPYSPEAKAIQLLSRYGQGNLAVMVGTASEIYATNALPGYLPMPQPVYVPPPVSTPTPPKQKPPNYSCGRNRQCQDP